MKRSMKNRIEDNREARVHRVVRVKDKDVELHEMDVPDLGMSVYSPCLVGTDEFGYGAEEDLSPSNSTTQIPTSLEELSLF